MKTLRKTFERIQVLVLPSKIQHYSDLALNPLSPDSDQHQFSANDIRTL